MSSSFLFENVVPRMTHRTRFIAIAQQFNGARSALLGIRASLVLCVSTQSVSLSQQYVFYTQALPSDGRCPCTLIMDQRSRLASRRSVVVPCDNAPVAAFLDCVYPVWI